MHLDSTLEHLRSHPKRWLGIVAPIIIMKLIEHRALTWTNERVDEGFIVILPAIRELFGWTVSHPWLSVFVVAAIYSMGMVAIAHSAVLLRFGIGQKRGPSLDYVTWHAGQGTRFRPFRLGGFSSSAIASPPERR